MFDRQIIPLYKHNNSRTNEQISVMSDTGGYKKLSNYSNFHIDNTNDFRDLQDFSARIYARISALRACPFHFTLDCCAVASTSLTQILIIEERTTLNSYFLIPNLFCYVSVLDSLFRVPSFLFFLLLNHLL